MQRLAIAMAMLLVVNPVQGQLAAPNDAGVTFAHVHLYVTDSALHRDLWTELFEAVPADRGGFVAVRVPGALIFLTERAPTASSSSTALDHFGLKVRDLESVLAAWRALGYRVDREFASSEGTRRACITMPDGARVELEEDPALRVPAEMSHVHFFAPDPGELAAWYDDLFGATPRSRGDRDIVTSVPGSRLVFHDSAETRLPTAGSAVDHIGFEVEDLTAFVEILRGRGIELEFGPHYVESLELWVAFFTDPSGVLVEVTEGLDRY